MKFKKTKITALALASVLALGGLSGCALTTTDSTRDLAQVVAEVDISKSDAFASGGQYAAYTGSIDKAEVLKRELVANYANYGQTYVSYYGYTAEQTYELIKNSLVNRQIYLQYARVYFFESGEYNLAGYNSAISSASEKDKSIAGLRYFLDEDEIAMAEYNTKQVFNSTLDSQEHQVIESNHSHSHDDSTSSTSRTTPTGADTKNSDFYDPTYDIYTGSNAAADCGTYETQDDSTPATRKQAYKNFLANLSTYGLINKGEDTSDITSLSYYQLERKSQYESRLISKLGERFEKEAEEGISEEWIREKFDKTLASQKAQFDTPNSSALESALDGVSDSSYVFYAPSTSEGYGYGFVINILLPFSTSQTQELGDSPADMGDAKGNKFVKRASLLEKLTATDQRSAWLSDYGYLAETEDGAFGGTGRDYLFFENNMKKSEPKDGASEAEYEKIKNYLGKYTYNGSVYMEEDEDGDKEYSYRPNKITIDGFLDEMESYLEFAGLHLTDKKPASEYFTKKTADYYNEDGTVDYSQFVYYSAKISELASFDANKIFLADSNENKAMSVINELSFAYNTDTAGLNSYLGYAVTPNNTNFVKEFEYAAQLAVKNGAGSITVAPSDYGWHIMYCTLSYAGNAEPYTFNYDEIEVEGTFSNLYYEALKADNFSAYSTDRQTYIINSFNTDDCVKVFTERYKDRYEV